MSSNGSGKPARARALAERDTPLSGVQTFAAGLYPSGCADTWLPDYTDAKFLFRDSRLDNLACMSDNLAHQLVSMY
jgi:hypothetical protein